MAGKRRASTELDCASDGGSSTETESLNRSPRKLPDQTSSISPSKQKPPIPHHFSDNNTPSVSPTKSSTSNYEIQLISPCQHEDIFEKEYKRSNRNKGTKIMRCFPHCCPGLARRSCYPARTELLASRWVFLRQPWASWLTSSCRGRHSPASRAWVAASTDQNGGSALLASSFGLRSTCRTA